MLEADKSPITLTPESLEFTASAATKTATVESVNEGDIEVEVPEDYSSWLSASISDGTISVSATANSGSAAVARSGKVIVTDAAGCKAEIAVSQGA